MNKSKMTQVLKHLNSASSIMEEVMDAEQTKYDNLSDEAQCSDRAEAMIDNVVDLEFAISDVESVINDVEIIIERN